MSTDVSDHLDEKELLLAIGDRLPPDRREHLAFCADCVMRVELARPDERTEPSALPLREAPSAPTGEDSGVGPPAPATPEDEEEDQGPIPWTVDPEMGGLEEAPAEALERGALVGRYVVLSELGQGGMGVVYAAHDNELDRKVALKLLKPGREGDGHTRLLREAQAMARVSHPNVLPVFDVGSFKDRVFVAMEFVSGGNLRDWIKAERPNWKQTLQKFISAGRGLAAAHAAGLVHRDFKPDNVLVGTDGRVFVTDFGLARLVSDTTPEKRVEVTEGSLTSAHLYSPLTQAGVVMGTPAYMAPEQHLGRMADARTDQFSFAAALYWALWKKRPFDPQRVAIAAALFEDGSTERRTMSGTRRRPGGEVIVPPPAEPKVPAWLSKAVLRALSLDPEERWPSMDALLEELERRSAGTRRSAWAVAGAATLLAISTGVVGYRQVQARAQRCSGGPALISRAWDDEARDAVKQAFEATGSGGAGLAFDQTAKALDAYAGAWTTMHREACEATRLREEQPEEVLSLRMACLDQRLHELRSLTGIFRTADVKLVDRAVDVANSLSDVAACANVSALTGRAPLPADETQRAEIARLYETLAEVKALRSAGRYKESLEKVEAIAPDSGKLHYPPLEASVQLARGLALERTSGGDAATGPLQRAFFEAEAGRDDLLKAEAATWLLYTLAELSRPNDARFWADAARAILSRVGGDSDLESQLWITLGKLQSVEGQRAEAVESMRRAVQLTERLPLEHPRRVSASRNLAAALVTLGNHEEALPLLRGAVEIIERTRGKDHASLAFAFYSLANSLGARRQYAEAHAQLDRALEILRARSGSDHPRVAGFLELKATLLQEEGRYEEALGTYRAALRIREAKFEANHPDLAFPLDGIGQCLLELGQAKAALPWLERALSVRSADPYGLGESRFALARALRTLKRETARAATLATQARADYEKAGEPEKAAKVAAWLGAK